MKNFEVYTTAEALQEAFRTYCNGRICSECPIDDIKCACELAWAMQEADNPNLLKTALVDITAIKDRLEEVRVHLDKHLPTGDDKHDVVMGIGNSVSELEQLIEDIKEIAGD